MKDLREFVNKTVREYLIENSNNDYHILYHGTDSEFFTKLDFDKAKKGERYNNPLGDGLYLTPNRKDALKFFGKNVYIYYLPKSSNIKKVTKENWEDDYNEIVLETIKKLGHSYDDLDRLSKNHIYSIYKWQSAQIKMLNRLTFLLSEIYEVDKHKVADVIEGIMNSRNRNYDAIWYDYGEVLIPTSKFNPNYFKEEGESFKNS
jgi:hypothetical protein